MLHYRIPKKIEDDWVLYNGFQARDLHGGDMTEFFSRNTVVCPVCLLMISPLRFLIPLDWVSHQAAGVKGALSCYLTTL